jgi:Ca2+-binding RTX toxin-like protein
MEQRGQSRTKTQVFLGAAFAVALATTLFPVQATMAAPACTISGDNTGDTLEGTPGDDVICGKGGNDYIWGKGGNDVLIGGSGADYLMGGEGNDVIHGQAGDDRVFGDAGSDRLYGEPGADRINGIQGTDHVFGGLDRDVCLYTKDGKGGDSIDGGGGRDGYNKDPGDSTVHAENDNNCGPTIEPPRRPTDGRSSQAWPYSEKGMVKPSWTGMRSP